MDLSKIITITGKPGLFKLISQSKGGFIVEDISDNKKTSIPANKQVSILKNISIYTKDEDMPLEEVFEKIAKKLDYKETIGPKSSSKELREFMEKVMPEYDKERVYDSDLKKLVRWYNTLLTKGILVKKEVKKEPTKAKSTKPKKETVVSSEE